MNPDPNPKPARTGHRGAAWTLVVLTPLIAELALGSTPVTMAWLVIIWMPVYGAGVLLIRELMVRTGRGWPSLILLAIAYELLEDGIGLQALTSPNLYQAAEWGARILGFNVPYWVAQMIYHGIFTVIIPIAVVNLLFPAHRGRPYLKRGGTIIAALVTVIGVALLRITVPPSMDPGYQAPLPFLIGCLAVIITLGVLALRVLPPASPQPHDGAVPGLPVLYLGSGLAIMIVLFLTFPIFGARQPAFTVGLTVLIPVAAAILGVAVAYRVLTRMISSARWSDRHSLAVIGGALVAHTIAGLIIMARTPVDQVGLAVIAALTVVGLVWFDRRLRRQAETLTTAAEAEPRADRASPARRP
ncbi:hypothetical protein [Microlunatus sp. GCM10028923]|uniref:hypothetical protein n=1 Tax=Microlunatus sp. GCM10028923 TaxID=3273400 RepID=UPI003605B729